jgi:hypothetical protein
MASLVAMMSFQDERLTQIASIADIVNITTMLQASTHQYSISSIDSYAQAWL